MANTPKSIPAHGSLEGEMDILRQHFVTTLGLLCDIELRESTLTFHFSEKWKAEVKTKFDAPFSIDCKRWPTSVETLLVGDCAPKQHLMKGVTLAKAVQETLILISNNTPWPALPKTLETKVTSKLAKSVDSSQGGTEDMDEDQGSEGSIGSGFEDQASGGTGFGSDVPMEDDDVDYDDYDAELEQMECDDLKNDVRLYLEANGEKSIEQRYDSVRMATCLQLIFQPSDYINQQTAEAWGVYYESPLIVTAYISGRLYRDATAPKVEVWQAGAPTSIDEYNQELKAEEELKERGRQKEIELRAIHYPNGVPASELIVLNDMVAKAVPGYTPGAVIPPKAKPFNPGRFGLQAQLRNIMNAFVAKTWAPGSILTASTEMKTPNKDDENIKKLVEMGYARDRATKAWNQSKSKQATGNLETAVNLLLDPDFGKSGLKTSSGKNILTSSQGGKKKKKRVKAEIDWSHGYLAAVGSYFVQRFATVNKYCVICDQPHVGVGATLLKPAVCTRDLCAWSFQQLGVGSDASSELATPVDVTDLLVSMVVSAAQSSRRDMILDPFPVIFDPTKPNKPVLSPDNKDWELLTKIVTAICSVETKLSQAWRMGLQKAHPLAWPLLNWITSSNRCHLVRLPPNYHVPSMGTPYQYLLISAPPEKEAEFRKNKAAKGSLWAFHGSGPENWHSIFRRGLINASGTKLQLNGAAYGHGIYCSPAASVSFGYSRMYSQGSPSTSYNVSKVTGIADPLRPQATNYCIALCEVVDDALSKNGDIWVQKESANIVTRIFFVYPDGHIPQSAYSNHCSQSKFLEEIEAAAKFYGGSFAGEDSDYEEDEC